MKKMMMLATLLAFTAPVFAGEQYDGKEGPKPFNGPRFEMQKDPDFKAKMEAQKADHKALREQMKAREDKLEKLVKEYKKAKEGSKKQLAAREEIGQILGEVRNEQITKREEQINGFEKRLTDMKARLDEEKSATKKTEWVDRMTERVIEEDGDLKEVLIQQGHMGKGGPQMDGPKHMKGPKGFGGKGGNFKGGQEDHILPMPPAPQEEK